MQEKSVFMDRKAAVALCIVLMMLTEQVCAGPWAFQVRSSSDRSKNTIHAQRRVARMTPLWRIMNSKPFGAYCQNNYECTTGICRAGHCSTSQRSSPEPVKY